MLVVGGGLGKGFGVVKSISAKERDEYYETMDEARLYLTDESPTEGQLQKLWGLDTICDLLADLEKEHDIKVEVSGQGDNVVILFFMLPPGWMCLLLYILMIFMPRMAKSAAWLKTL